METAFTDNTTQAPTPPPTAPAPTQAATQPAATTTNPNISGSPKRDATGTEKTPDTATAGEQTLDLYGRVMYHAVIIKDGSVHVLSQATKRGLTKDIEGSGDVKLIHVFRGKMVKTGSRTVLSLG